MEYRRESRRCRYARNAVLVNQGLGASGPLALMVPAPEDFPKGIDVFVLSVPHTGTRFTESLLSAQCAMHTDMGDSMELLRPLLDISRIIVSPLRHPLKVWHSFCLLKRTRERYFECWRGLELLDREYDIHYFPIDVDRQASLSDLSRVVGRDLKTDWTPVGVNTSKRGQIVEQDLSYVYGLPMIRGRYSDVPLIQEP